MTALTASAERELYETNRSAWIAYVAPRTAARLATLADDVLGDNWALLTRDYQRQVWPLLDAATQQRIRAARNAAVWPYNVPAPTHLPVANCPQPDQGNARA